MSKLNACILTICIQWYISNSAREFDTCDAVPFPVQFVVHCQDHILTDHRATFKKIKSQIGVVSNPLQK